MRTGLRRRPFWWGAGAAALTLSCGGAAAAIVAAPSIPRISADRAIALAANDLALAPDGFRLQTPKLRAAFTAAGLRVTPRGGGPSWSWRLTGVDAPGVELGRVPPTARGRLTVDYLRGAIVERYRLRSVGVEQQFVLSRAPSTGIRDVAIEGRITSSGQFEKVLRGWQWRNEHGAVTLGDVTVLDARGRKLPARMRVTDQATRIVIDGAALASAAYPVTVDPEIGANDFPISQFSSLTNRDASQAAVAYNPTNDEYLVVWRGDGLTTDDEVEIFGQRLNATTGAEIGTNDFRISDVGPEASTLFAAADPAIAFNSAANQYLVVWRADDSVAPLVNDEVEIFGQRLNSTGAQIGANDFRISDMGPDGDTAFGAFNPAVAYKRSVNDYLVAWHGDDGTDGEFEVYGQMLDAGGFQTGTNDFRVSDLGPDGNVSFDANRPTVANNPTSDEFLVVWDGDDDTAPLVENENEIFGQRLSSTGAELGTNDFRVSDQGPDGNATFDAFSAAVSHNPSNNEYLVVWEGDDDTAPLVDEEFEIFGQLLSADGLELGANDFRISDMGTDGSAGFTAVEPAVANNPTSSDYLVVWRGDDGTPPLVDNEFEIFGQRLNPSGTPIGSNDFRVSDMGPDGSPAFDPAQPAVARSAGAEYLVVWQGDDDNSPLVDNAFEIFGQRDAPGGPTAARVVAFATRRTDAGVVVSWRTGSEVGILGFNLWRGRAKLNRRLIEAKSSRGTAYRFVDSSAKPGARYAYRLDLVFLDGTSFRGVTRP